MTADELGPLAFGLVIGFVTYRTLRRTSDAVKLSDIASVIAAVGGGVVTALMATDAAFNWYSIGLAIGFFLYLVLGHTILKDSTWLGGGS